MNASNLNGFLEMLSEQFKKDFELSDLSDSLDNVWEQIEDGIKSIFDDLDLSEVEKKVQEFLNENLPKIKEQISSQAKRVKTTLSEKIDKELMPSIEGLRDSFKARHRIHVIEMDIITFDELVRNAKENIVAGAKYASAYKAKVENQEIIYLAYLDSNKQLLPIEKNIYLVLVGNSIDKTIDNYFGELKLIILK